ncbi:MAG: hypothetical protein GX649_17665 [Chloroflexi bacterium]|nr:hypothetical protein [Chloroflexota bacterium]
MPDQYWSTPQGDYASRRQAFLEFSAAHSPAPGDHGRGGLFTQICRLELDRGPIDEDAIRDALAYVNARHDCADFTVAGLLRMLYLHAANPLLPLELVQATCEALLNFKYWIDEPGYDDLMCFWSENHQIMFHSDEYLAGQLLAEQVFPNVGQDGRWHMARARERILRWIDVKARVGFSEWDSNCYYDEDMTPLLNLADFAEDEEIAGRAAMILDVMFLDMAVDSFRGVYGTSHGRTYPTHVLSGRQEATAGVQKIAWGLGVFNNPNNMTAVSMATSPRYRVPEIIESLAQDLPEEMENRERQAFRLEDAAALGIRPDDPETALFLWAAGMHQHQTAVEATTRLADAFHSHRWDVVMRPYSDALQGTYREMDRLCPGHDGDVGRSVLSEVSKYTYRTPDYMLSCAQDHRKGKPGYQQHIWQATLGPDALAFALHRGNADETAYKYWVGRFPRAAQHRNVLVALYDIAEQPLPGPATVYPADAEGNAMPSPGPSEEELLPCTVAVLRRAAFDEVREANGWVLARSGDGYLALRSQQPVRWTPDGVLQGEGLIADGRRNVWICQMGRRAVDGPFDAWCAQIAEARVAYGDLSVEYDAPGLGRVAFAWEGDFTVDGLAVPLSDYPRFDNPYCRAEHGAGVYEIAYGGRSLRLDFGRGRREETPAPPPAHPATG